MSINENNIPINFGQNKNAKFHIRTFFGYFRYELKTFFSGSTQLDEQAIEAQQRSIDRQRKSSVEEFFQFFSQCDFEQTNYHSNLTIHRRHICEHHLSHCKYVERYMINLFSKWDQVLALFPSHSALEQYDRRFNPRTKEGGIFYGKLSIFQAWFNLHSEINRLIHVLGRIMACTRCQMWPNEGHSSSERTSETTSRPPTPSSTTSNEQRDSVTGSPPHVSQFPATFESRTRRQNTLSSIPSMDNINQQPLTPTSSLMDYYYR